MSTALTSPASRSLRAPGPRSDPRLDPIRAKVERGERLSLADGEILFDTPDLWSVLEMADLVRRRLHGDAAYYNINRHLNYSNVCALSCKFCEFYRKKDEPGSYTRDMAYVRDEVKRAVEGGATEMHVVGGLHPYLPFSYYTDLVSTIREAAGGSGGVAEWGSDEVVRERSRTRESDAGTRGRGDAGRRNETSRDSDSASSHASDSAPSAPSPLRHSVTPSLLHIKAFTAVEIVHLAKIAKVYKQDDRRAGIRWVLTELKKAGLGSLPGGGAEVFDDRVHDEAYKGKIRSDVWLDVHRTAHELGLNTNATLLYGHIESRHDRLVHMDMLRRAQDEALARMGYAGEKWRSDGVTEWRSDEEGSGHLGYRGEGASEAPVVTLTRPGVPLPEHVAFGGDGRSVEATSAPHLASTSATHASAISPPHLPASAPPHVSSDANASHAPSRSRLCTDPHSATSSLRHSATPPLPAGYYQTIIPLPFFPDGCDLEHLPGPSGLENYRTLAVARLMLDNFPHVKAFWIMQTLPMAQLMLQSGADDLDGTVVWYDITKVAQGGGAESSGTHQEVSVWTLEKAIREAGFRPIERDSLYRRIKRDGKRWSVT